MNPAPRPANWASDAAARERIRTSLDESLIVEASAGTGKTTVLVQRIVAVLAARRAEIQEIAAVTFTHKAAGEMKLRLRQELDDQRRIAGGDRKQALEDALERLEEASIGTIHSFCALMLRERPVEANIDPAFEELSDQEANRIYQQAFRAWLERRLDQDSPGLRRAFARLAWRESGSDSSPFERLQQAGWKLVEWRDYSARWTRMPFARTEEIDTLIRLVKDLADLSSQPRRVDDNLYKSLQPVRDLAGWIALMEGAGSRDLDTIEARLLKLARDLRKNLKKGTGQYGGGIDRAELVAKREELIRWIQEFRVRADAELAWLLREETGELLEEYDARKRRLGKLDFVDLLCCVRDLLKNDRDVRTYFQNKFKCVFVDEFQDTDPLQAEILMLLCADDPAQKDWLKTNPRPGKLFVVGDPKQSIYKFRRADLVLYRDVRRRLEARGIAQISLMQSFRSVPNIQQFVNAAFETRMSGDVRDGHAEWAPLERFREEIPGRPSVIALPVPEPYGIQKLSKDAVVDSLPDAMGAFVYWLVKESGWGFEAKDIAILFRKRNYYRWNQTNVDLTRETARALENRGIAHLLAGSKSLHHREEVETLRAALTAIEWPDDELSVFAALKGSLFAISDEMLFLYRHRYHHLHPFRKEQASEAGFQPIERALDELANLHRLRNRRPFAATVHALLEATRAHAGFLLRPGGQQILANVGRVAELARTYETTGGISFRGFVEELEAKAEKEEAAEAPVLEEDSDGVRLMTVHGAKGLEFRAVILADLISGLSRDRPDAWIDGEKKICAVELLGCPPAELTEHADQEAQRDRAEGIRIAYVACTRARDLLVIPAVGDDAYPKDGWLSPLYEALYPVPAAKRKSLPADGCPRFGASSVLLRPPDYGDSEDSVKPGLIQPEAGNHQVIWWDPSALKLGEEQNQTKWHDEVLRDSVKEDGGVSLEEYRSWSKRKEQVLSAAAKPTLQVFLASQAGDAPPEIFPLEFVSTSASARAVSGKRFGALVHSVLRDVPLEANTATVSRFAELNARVLGAPPEETDAARQAVEASLAHELLARARAAERVHREYPLSLRITDGRWFEGVIDLAFFESDTWVVVDFKTDADTAPRREQYERQLQWYTYALAKLTGQRARGVLLSL